MVTTLPEGVFGVKILSSDAHYFMPVPPIVGLDKVKSNVNNTW
jgi:hypothetical protein